MTDETSTNAVRGQLPPGAAAALLFGSGVCALVYQTAWLKSLRLVFGASTSATAATLAIFMGGLGIGGALLGKMADRHRRPLALYGNLEILIGILAGFSPLLIDLVRSIYIALGGSAQLGGPLSTVVRLALSTLVLGGTTVLMGGTLPAAVRAVVRDNDEQRASLGLVYGANTLGAVLGVFITGFFLLELLGTRATVITVAAINVGIGLAARIIGQRAPELPESPAKPITTSTPSSAGRPARWFVLVAAAVVGFAFLLMELVWYRMLAPLLGGSSYTFAVILAFALLGIGAGGLLYGRRDPNTPTSFAGFATTCLLEAAFMLLPFAFGDQLAYLALSLRELSVLGLGGLVGAWSIIATIVVLPAALVAGYQFPLLVSLMGAGRDGVGQEIGLVYACNTAGSIVGSLAGGFGIIPLLSAPGTWRLVGWLLIITGLGAILLDRRRGLRLIAPIAWGALAVAFVLPAGPSAVWRHTGIGAHLSVPELRSPVERERWERSQRQSVVWEADGVEGAVAITEDDGVAFILNGKIDGNARWDASNFIMSGLLGTITHPNPRRILVIGLGTGGTAGWLAAIPEVERVDVVELEPTTLEVARRSAGATLDALNNPKVNIIIGDAREFLPTTSETYDLIISQPSNPYRAGISSLYTADYYESALAHLAEGGLFMQWLQAYHVDALTVRRVYATLRSVFPFVESWESAPGDSLVLRASREAPAYSAAALRQRMASEPYQAAFENLWGIGGLEGLLTAYVGGPALADAHQADADAGMIATDDQNPIEYGFARSLAYKDRFNTGHARALAMRLGAAWPTLDGPFDPRGVAELQTIRLAAEMKLPPMPPGLSPAMQARISARRAWMRHDYAGVLQAFRAQPAQPGVPLDAVMLAEAGARLGDESVIPIAERARAARPAEAAAAMVHLHIAKGRTGAAVAELQKMLTALQASPWVAARTLIAEAMNLAVVAGERDASVIPILFDALEPRLSAAVFDRYRRLARARLGRMLGPPHCLTGYAPFEPWAPFEGDILQGRIECYAAAGDEREAAAREDLALLQALEPPRFDDGVTLPENLPKSPAP